MEIFWTEYPDADKSIMELLKAIHIKMEAHRKSKNGTPEQRTVSETPQGEEENDSDDLDDL